MSTGLTDPMDPRERHAKPEYPRNPVDAPGRESEMTPRADHGEQSYLGRAGQPAEAAPINVLIASQAGSYITGQIYGVTGGDPLI